MIKIAILGLGNVGTSVLNIIRNNQDLIYQKIGENFEIVGALVRDKTKHLEKGVYLASSFEEILSLRPDIIVELIGSVNPALEYIIKSLENDIPVVTANKEVLAKYPDVIFALADKKRVPIYFEAAVGGGIPIVRPLKVCLAANRIKEIMGILNGTTNYILTKLDEGLEFESALKEAQEKGYAEANPESDLSGMDALYKIAILSSVSFGVLVDIKELSSEGINKISLKDVLYARDLGYKIKLIARSCVKDNKYDIRVYPMLLPFSHPLASVNNNMNSILVKGDFVGSVMFYGQGAGGNPTASAVASDIMDIGWHIKNSHTHRLSGNIKSKATILKLDELFSRFYLRAIVKDNPGVLAKIAKVLADNDVSIKSMVQKTSNKGYAELVFIVHQCNEQNFYKSIEDLKLVDSVKQIASTLRVYED
ncbi:homoserine dehydrogenase [Thermodesulfobium acidiphilum]|uniref:Homoserine dehydrogenase n=1 Tax=Thermodesulfobium acidiphilum TaxID=1794699 RepID=A0A2R4W0D3_THEAF|nr:homoserine dehydrogenase [Thermodesulfobium acidiphilum]AWB10212.1 homoserine dehydrogenase [Thermodesulfobium acidiphilum]